MASAFLEFKVQSLPPPALDSTGEQASSGQLATVLLPKGAGMESLVPAESLGTAQCPDRNACCCPPGSWGGGRMVAHKRKKEEIGKSVRW